MARALVFPGQGSQAVGMGRELYAAFATARLVFEEVDEALKQKLARLMFEGPESELTLTENAQPALMTASLAAFRVLAKDGALALPQGAACVAGHGVWVSADEMEMIAESEAAIIYNPTANMILGSGVCPLGEFAAYGVPMGIGTDGMASNDSHNMIEVMKIGALLQKVHRLDPEATDARQILRMSTIEGARALGLGAITGSLEVGKRADLVRFDGNSFGAAVVHDPYQQIVYGAGPESIADVWVDGRRLLADGAFVSFDPKSIVPKIRELAKALARAGNLSEFSCLAR